MIQIKVNDVLQNKIDSILIGINQHLSTYIDDSDISLLNKNITTEPIKLSTILIDVISQVLNMYDKSDGNFDITVKPVVDIWGFSYNYNLSKIPDSSKINSLMKHVGSDKIKLNELNFKKTDPNLQIDLSGIAKGWGVDRIGKYLYSKGIDNIMIEIGGEILLSGQNEKNENWEIGIVTPYVTNLEIYKSIKLTNQAIATSGTYNEYFTLNNINYSHIIDPNSGYPVKHELVSATIIAETCATADAVATAVIVKGINNGVAWVNELESVECFLIGKNENGDYYNVKSNGFNY